MPACHKSLALINTSCWHHSETPQVPQARPNISLPGSMYLHNSCFIGIPSCQSMHACHKSLALRNASNRDPKEAQRAASKTQAKVSFPGNTYLLHNCCNAIPSRSSILYMHACHKSLALTNTNCWCPKETTRAVGKTITKLLIYCQAANHQPCAIQAIEIRQRRKELRARCKLKSNFLTVCTYCMPAALPYLPDQGSLHVPACITSLALANARCRDH